MNDSESSEMKAWLAAIEASPMRATRVVNTAKADMSSTHWPPIGSPVRSTRRSAAMRARIGPVP